MGSFSWRIARCVALCLAIVGSLFAFSLIPAHAATPQNLKWSAAVNVSRDRQQTHTAVMRVDSTGTIHVLWLNAADSTTGALPFEVNYANSTDGGKTWGNKYNISTNKSLLSSTINDIAMALDSQNRAHILWSERSGKDRVLHVNYIRRNTDGTWTKPMQVADAAAGQDPYSGDGAIDIAVDPGSVNLIHVAWRGGQNSAKANWGIYYANSSDDGSTCKNFSAVSTTGGRYGDMGEPALLAEPGGNVHVVWSSVARGVEANHGTWNATTQTMTWQRVGNNTPRERIDRYGRNMSLARDPNTGAVYVAYLSLDSQGGISRGIRFATWTAGKGWSRAHQLADGLDPSFAARHPSIAVDSKGTIYVTFSIHGKVQGNGIAYNVSTDGGQKWLSSTHPVPITGALASDTSLRFVPNVNGHDWLYLVYTARVGTPDKTGHGNYDAVFRAAQLT